MLEIKFCPAWPVDTALHAWKAYVTSFDGALILPHILLARGKEAGEIFLQSAEIKVSRQDALGKQITAAYCAGFESLNAIRPTRAPGEKEGSVPINLLFRDALVKISPARVSIVESADLAPLDLSLTAKFKSGQANETQQSLTATCTFQPKAKPSFLLDQTAFDGWLALDFGTSNSTATVWRFDRKTSLNTIPIEHRNAMLEGMLRWLNTGANSSWLGSDERLRQEWKLFVADLESKHVPQLLAKQYHDAGSERLTWEDAIRDIEKSLSVRTSEFRRAAGKQLASIYDEALKKPALFDKAIDQMPLEFGSRSIRSNLLLRSSYPDLKALMGRAARKEYENLLIESGEASQLDVFHPSPKRYLWKQQSLLGTVPAIGAQTSGAGLPRRGCIGSPQIIEAAYDALFTAVWKADKRDEVGYRFPRIVATFPTISSPAMRQEIKKTLQLLGVDEVSLRYDEAIAAVMFHIWLEYCNSPEPMLESFRIGSEINPNERMVKRVLLVDVGGGTTDLAVIEIELHEEKVFEDGEDRGAGGRYYVLTPKLLRSTGNMQLGGDLMTLVIFRLFKVSLANYLYLNRDKIGHKDLHKNVAQMDQSLQPDNQMLNVFRNHYRHFDAPLIPEMESVLLAADKLLPTRSKGEVEKVKDKLQLFASLWETAEELKEKLSGWSATKPVIFQPEELKNMLEVIYPGADLSKAGPLSIPYEHFKEALDPVIRKIGDLIAGMFPEGQERAPHIHWLILSGQACKLDLLQMEVNRLCTEIASLATVRQRTFEPEHAKTATSTGAIITERYNQLRPDVRDSKSTLQSGRNLIHIDTNFLFHYLPAGFKIEGENESDRLLEPNTTMWQLDEDRALKARSRWVRMRKTNLVRRIDFNNEALPWGTYEWYTLQRRLNEQGQRLQNNEFWLMMEVTDELLFTVFVRRDEPLYLIDGSANVCHSMKLPAAKSDSPGAAGEQAIIGDQLIWDIIIREENGRTLHTFKRGSRLEEQFAVGPGRLKGTYVLLQPSTALSGLLKEHEEYTLVIRRTADGPEEELDRMPWKVEPATRNYARVVVLLQDGTLQLQKMLPKFKVTKEPLDLLKAGEGFVLKDVLGESKRSRLEDPFDGTH